MNLTPKNEKLLQKYIDSRDKQLSDKTIYNYHYTFFTFQDKLNINDLEKISMKDLQTKLNKTTINAGVISKMLILLKNLRPKDVSEFELLISKYNKTQKQHTDLRTNQQKLDVSYEQLQSILEKLEGIDYLWFYILFTYGTRLRDLYMIYTDDEDLIKDVNAGESVNNILYFKGNKLYYVRNDYKTKDTYGVMTLEIKDKQFKQILKSLPINEYVIRNAKNEPLATNQMSSYIKRVLNKLEPNSNLTESQIYKIIIEHFANVSIKLIQYSKTRPHQIATQTNTYS